MGGTAMIGLGLALAQPQKRVAVLTGDGDMLMVFWHPRHHRRQTAEEFCDRRAR